MQGSYIGNTTASQAVKAGSIPVPCSNKKVPFVYQTKGTFLSDAFLRNEMRTACVVQASPVMHAFGACMERIVSPITAQLHHLLLICKHT